MKFLFFQGIISLLFFVSNPGKVEAQEKVDHSLTRELQEIVKGFEGKVGVYVKNLHTNRTVAINSDTIFPTASMIKIPIMIGVVDKMARKELSDTQTLVYKDSLLYAGVDILGSFKSDEQIQLGKVMMLMLTMSDNTASLWLQSLAGTGTRINTIMDSIGMKQTRVNSRTAGREENRSRYGWGQTTPREMAMLMEKIVKRELISPEFSDEMLKLLSRNYWNDVSLAQIPAGVFVASKNGAVDASRSEVVYVNTGKASYVFCITTKENEDVSWGSENEAWVMTRKVSKLLWQRYGATRKN